MFDDVERKCAITVETYDGKIWHGVADNVQVSEIVDNFVDFRWPSIGTSMPEPVLRSWSMELSGAGVLYANLQDRGVYLKSARSASEWMCAYCGAVNPRARTQCSQCGGPRSFVYGL